ncbi:hypothetical protein ACOMHN_017860 [Nucella lapillus]
MMETFVPSKTASVRHHQPWICTKLKKLSRRKYRAWRRAKTSKKTSDWARYKDLKKKTRQSNRQAQQEYVNKIVEEDNRANLWKLIKNRRNDSTGVSPLKQNGLTFSKNKTKADILNEQFCSVFTKEDTVNIPQLDPGPHPTMPDVAISEQGVFLLLAKLNPRKASGPDGIPTILLKETAREIAPALTSLFQLSLDTGLIPKIWKHALVQPVFKKGDRSQAANYRPISLTCVCCKLMEHIIRHEITRHVEHNKIITDAQHGFRKRRSCETQLILTAHDLAAELSNKGQTDLILLDFSKAFDKVPHLRLLSKLELYGVRGKTKQWIESFLHERTQQVVVEGESSTVG